MKYVTFVVPSYNSQDYLNRCVDSLLVGGEDVEIIIVNDGSTDNTGAIADEYCKKYPDIVRAVHKQNGGHGSGINAGLKHATGMYFKVVDSDDWLDEGALRSLLSTIKAHEQGGVYPDLYVTNFIYDRITDGKFYISSYEKMLPQDKICGWDEVKKFRTTHMMLMHSLMYKRETLIKSGIVLPEHTFYEDNYFAYMPLPHTKTLCYLNLNLYHYFIGRSDQSVNINNFTKRYEQQIRVMNLMTDAYRWDEINSFPKGLKNYMRHSIDVVTMNTLLFTCAEKSDARVRDYKNFWNHIKTNDKKMYGHLRRRSYSVIVNYLPWKLRGAVLKKGYFLLCKTIKLG
ncbi:MAG: glycosyltransferase family 2 protein [Candidatus Coproplasma sp.]